MAATIRFNGPNTFEAHADAARRVLGGAAGRPLPRQRRGDRLPAAGRSARRRRRADQQLDVTLRPANADVTLTPQAIVLRVPIKFRSGAPKLAPAIKAELEAVADILVDHPEIKTLRIEAHWSGAGKGKGGDAAKKLTQKQADGHQGLPGGQGGPGRPHRDRRAWGASRPWSPTWAPPTRPRTAGSSWSSQQ